MYTSILSVWYSSVVCFDVLISSSFSLGYFNTSLFLWLYYSFEDSDKDFKTVEKTERSELIKLKERSITTVLVQKTYDVFKTVFRGGSIWVLTSLDGICSTRGYRTTCSDPSLTLFVGSTVSGDKVDVSGDSSGGASVYEVPGWLYLHR